MRRLEIVANRSVEEDLFQELQSREVGSHYTRIDDVSGVGTSGPRQGDHIWPEINFLLIIYCDEAEAAGVRAAVAAVKERFTDEGVKLFELGP